MTNARRRLAPLTLALAVLAGCAATPKKAYDGPERLPNELSAVYPGTLDGLLLIKSIDGRSTYTASIGYLGAVHVLPGTHELELEVSYSMGSKKDERWTVPPGVPTAPVEGAPGSSLLGGIKGVGRVKGTFGAGESYDVRFGFDRSGAEPRPVLWIAPRPVAATSARPTEAHRDPIESSGS